MTDEQAPVSSPVNFDPVPPVAQGLGLAPGAVAAVIAMLDEGNTVPFIARYRKERTGGLDEVQIRAIEERREYLVELETRRAAILASVGEQGKLTPELEAKLRAADSKSDLEDLYAPHRPRRKTRASVARDKGLEPLALRILAQTSEGDPGAEAAGMVTAGLESAEDALAGARDIVAEVIADTAEVRRYVRREFAEHGTLVSEVVPGKSDEPTKFEQYYQFSEAVKTIPSHRFLAIRRGEAEGVLRAHVAVEAPRVIGGVERLAKLDPSSPWAAQLALAIADAFKRLLAPSVENDVRAELKQRSDTAAVEIFAGNLRNLLLAAPLGTASVIGIDPGLRTGCKCAAIDATGKFLGTVTIYITQGDAQLAKAKDELLAFVGKFPARAIAVGNGTGGREAEIFVKRTLGDAGLREGPEAPFVVQVNEAGASVYSASDLAREEFPELDLTIRGAISIARRLQDPLAELVKIEPKSIGVGQYQHDVNQNLIVKKLGDVVEDCVNRVGVELNTASAQLLGYVAGIGKSLAKKIVVHRDSNGKFGSRDAVMAVSGFGPKAFEQAAGFLRIAGASHPLDGSSVHPERYPLVEKIAADVGVELPQLIGNQELVDKIDFSRYVTDDVGEPTLRDIAAELAKPGRDPRAEFEPPKFRDDVTSMEDLKVGMVLEGIVTNVTAFGAFVDIGVHNDGLVHVSQLSDQFVADPSAVVKVGQKMTVRVLEVDNQRKRIALSARKAGGQQQRQPQQPRGEGPPQQARGGRGRGGRGRGPGPGQGQGPAQQPSGDRPQGEPQDAAQHNRGPRRDRGEHGRETRQWQPHGDGAPGEPRPEGAVDAQGGDSQRQGGDPSQGAPGHDGQPGQGAQGQAAQGHGQGEPRRDQRGPGRGRGPRGNDQRGFDPRGPNDRGPNQRGPYGGGPNDRGPNQRGAYGGGPNDRGPNERGPNDRGPNDRGPHGGPNDRGPNDRGPNDRGPNDRGPNDRGPNDRGPQQGGGEWQGRSDRGPNDRGPNDRGPNDRPNDRGPHDRGPSDRGPQQGGGEWQARNDRGPRRDDRRGPPRDDRRGPPRDDRRGPPRDDRRPAEPPSNWGVSGFTNNPFAKKLSGNDNNGDKQ